MTTYKVTLHLEDGTTETIQVPDNEYILDIAEEDKVPLPSSCHAGACGSCVARLIEGEVDQTDQSWLDEEQVAKGYVVMCQSFAKTDVKLQAGVENELYEY